MPRPEDHPSTADSASAPATTPPPAAPVATTPPPAAPVATSPLDPQVDGVTDLPDAVAAKRRERGGRCAPINAIQTIPLATQVSDESRIRVDDDFVAIREGFKSACQSCHLAPGSDSGKFSYLDNYKGRTLDTNGVTRHFDGISDVAPRALASLRAGRMPPQSARHEGQDYSALIQHLDRWLERGAPARVRVPIPEPSRFMGFADPSRFSSIGDCTPDKAFIGHDTTKDKMFSSTASLPDDLEATDFTSFDADQLAAKGTIFYDVEYPLWTDNARKSRMIHLPSTQSGGIVTRTPATYDPATKSLQLPTNARLYKTFFRAVKHRDGGVTFRPIETRVIVVRQAPSQPLYGTYVWNDDATAAKLLKTPYRDGTPWKDYVVETTIDEASGATRKYAVPARHRCQECHMGGDNGSFVIGFTPLQLNRRQVGEAGREIPVGAADLSQLQRLIDYGMITGITTPTQAPKLEQFASSTWQNAGLSPSRRRAVYSAQSYALGNCAFCHRPEGLAMKTQGVQVNLQPGQIFDFNTKIHAKDNVNRRIVDPNGDLDRSFLYFRVAASKEQQGLIGPMPRHSPGGPDCRGVTIFGRWIQSYNPSLTDDALENWTPKEACTPNQDFNAGTFDWTEEDFTSSASVSYVPRRQDWADPSTGMPASYRSLSQSRALAALVNKSFAVDFWQSKPECTFPRKPIANRDVRPWMKDAAGRPKQPLNQVYLTTPGAWIYTTTCSKCHGEKAKGDGEIGRALAAWSGGNVTVANLADGMFGRSGENLDVFATFVGDAKQNLAANYLIWMAMEGTRINIPPQASAYLGKHKAQMLKQVRDRCARQIPTSPKASSPLQPEHELYHELCLFGNGPATSHEIQFDPKTDLPVNQAAQDAWLDRGALNAGWAIYAYLKEATRHGAWQPRQSECERRQ